MVAQPPTDDLHDKLTEIRGVGNKTADSILEVLREHERQRSDGPRDENGDPVHPTDDRPSISRLLADAVDHHRDGRHEYAGKFVRRAYERLDG